MDSVAVIGRDLDDMDISSIDVGDRLLIEYNGYDANPGPLRGTNTINNTPWTVEYAAGSTIKLSHDDIDKPLLIDCTYVISRNPICFLITPIFNTKKPRCPLIMKYVAYYDEPDKATFENQMPSSGIKIVEDRNELIQHIIVGLRALKPEGWAYNSLNRFILRTRADSDIIAYMLFNEIGLITQCEGITDKHLHQLYVGLLRSKLWARQNDDSYWMNNAVADIPPWKQRIR